MIKAAQHHDLPVVEGIMKRIHNEDPSYWPHGLETNQFNGGLYLVKESASASPVGFVGWQKLPEGERQVGYYSIGILPEHRERGFAKAAVTQVMREISASCDEVKALVMSHNEPSKALAKSLDVTTIEKAAALKALGSMASGLGTASLLDLAVNKDKGAIGAYGLGREGADKWSGADFLLNFLAGATAPYVPSPAGRAALIGGAAAKTVATPAVRNQARGNEILDQIKDKVPRIESSDGGDTIVQPKNAIESIPKEVWLGAGGLGLGALGVLVYNAKKKRDLKEKELEQHGKGNVEITLPTKQKGDSETKVILPFDDFGFSKALQGRLRRDTKRRLYEETKQRTRRRKAKDPNNPTKKELEDAQLTVEHAEIDKAAAIAGLVSEIDDLRKAAIGPQPAPQAAVPSPPGLGGNPAVRMQQQEAAVKAMPPAQTQANPAIMQAEQKAMQAEQAAQQQAAQQEATAQQAQMDQQAQFQQQMMKSEQEKETLKLELEKQKALAELNDATSKAQEKATADASNGEGTMTQRLISNRISRLQKRVAKAASTTNPVIGGSEIETYVPGKTPGTPNPQTGNPVPKPMGHLRPGAANIYNQKAVTHGRASQPLIARASYLGPLGDTLFGLLGKNFLFSPRAQQKRLPSRTTTILDPDKSRVIAQTLGARIGGAFV